MSQTIGLNCIFMTISFHQKLLKIDTSIEIMKLLELESKSDNITKLKAAKFIVKKILPDYK